MTESRTVECSFFIPIHRDANLSDGALHGQETWEKLNDELFARFDAGTAAPDLYRGFYRDPDSGQRVDDESRRFLVAVSETALDEVRRLLVEACEWFQQKCIYLSVAGQVEFVRKP